MSFLGRPRPGLLTFIGVVSLIWSAFTLIGVVVGVVVGLLVGAGLVFAGTAWGVVGWVVVVLVLTWLVVSSALSILLFQAGYATLRDDPAGIAWHRLWAWISLGLDAVGLLATGGTAPNSWTGVAYAIFVLYVTSRPEVAAYFQLQPAGKALKPAAWSDELA